MGGLKLSKFLQTNLDKCTGCRTCEIVCSLTHSGECNPPKSRIHVTRMKMKGVMVPVYCKQCVKPPCAKNCSVNAIRHDAETGMVLVDYQTCIGCKNCIQDCPFGAMTWDTDAEKVIKCDLCGGKPQCAKYCIDKALIFTQPNEAGKQKRNNYTAAVARSYLSKSKEA